MRQHVLIVNAGKRMSLSAEAGDYDDQVAHIKRYIEEARRPDNRKEPTAFVEVVKSVEEAERLLPMVDAVIFVTAGLLHKAQEFKNRYPTKKIVVFTGLLPENQVVVLNKAWLSQELVQHAVLY